MSIDKDGFYQLEWKSDTLSIPKHEPDEKPKKLKGWKKDMLKKLKRAPKPSCIKKFHNTKLTNLKVDEGSQITFKQNKNKCKPSPKAYILISLGEGIYHRLSVKTYHKLLKINKVMIEFTFLAKDDYSDKAEVLSKSSTIIQSINDLLRFVLWERMRIDAVYEVQAKASVFTDYDFKYRIAVMKSNGELETYRDINKFLANYNLNLI